MRKRSLLMAVLVLAACSGGRTEGEEAARPELTQRQRDSIIGESSLPGAQGVKGALEASDAAAARAARLDSIQQ
ncbi:MAG TPA: hypothetical protein VF188_17290 [Longimicrobiales bacterium]